MTRHGRALLFMELKKTPLYEAHKALGAKIVSFAGWQMPVQYASLIEEHIAVRQRCGLFDVSHMGEIEVSGRDALCAVERLTTNNASRLIDGSCQYTLLCNEKGGVVDDVFLYRISKERFMFCVNADNADKIYEWIKKNTRDAANVKNLSDDYAQLALQGPFSERILAKVSETDPSAIKRNRFATIKVCGIETLVSRTGYTGEDGFELYIKPEGSEKVWSGLLQAGKEHGILPCGLGARDTLRLEMGYPLYGHELSEEITPIEAGLSKYVAASKEDFIGKEPLVRQINKGVSRNLIGFFMEDDGIPRTGYRILNNETPVGEVTSGTFSPSMRRAIGMGFVVAGCPGAGLAIEIRGKARKANAVTPPFYAKDKVK